MFRTIVIAVAGFVVGATATYAVVLFGTLAAWQMLGVVDQDGGGSMGLAFVIAPLAALVGGIITAIVTIVRVHQRLQGTPIGSDERQRGVSRFSLLGGVLVTHTYRCEVGACAPSQVRFGFSRQSEARIQRANRVGCTSIRKHASE